MTRPSYSVRIGEGENSRVISYNCLARHFIPPNAEIRAYVVNALLKLHTDTIGGGNEAITPLCALEELQEQFQVSYASVIETAIVFNKPL